MKLSIIVPVFNEAPLLRPFLHAFARAAAPGAEIIVADGGSTDGTADLAQGFCDQLVVSEPKPGNTNECRCARRAWRHPLVSSMSMPKFRSGCLNEIERILNDADVVGGYFRIRLPRGPVYRLTDTFAHYAGILLRMRCGDHGIFCRRTAFLDIGGFPEVPLMEDVEFFRRLHRVGRVMCSHKRILGESASL